MSKINVIIMAGGLGKRMKSHMPKVLHIVDGLPMIVRVIKEALKLKPNKIMLVVGKYREIITVSLTNFDVLKYVTFVEQKEPLGTGHAIQCAYNQLEKLEKDEKVLVLSGDTPLITSSLMSDMLVFEKIKIMTTMRGNPTGYGRIKLGYGGIFEKIIEDKDCSLEELQIKLVNCGIYSFKNEYLLKNLYKLKNDNKQNEYYITDLIEIIKNNEKVNVEIYNLEPNRRWELINVNNKEQLEFANFVARRYKKL